jgi:hypothetical protein
VRVNENSLDDSQVREQFAPAQYLELSQEEKMNRPSYEPYPAGTDVGNDRVDYGSGDQAATQTLGYEQSVIDRETGTYRKEMDDDGHVAVETADALATVSAVARSDARNTGRDRFDTPDDAVSVSATGYVVARVDSMSQVRDGPLPGEPTTYTEAEQALSSYLDDNAAQQDDLQVVASHELGATGGGSS